MIFRRGLFFVVLCVNRLRTLREIVFGIRKRTIIFCFNIRPRNGLAGAEMDVFFFRKKFFPFLP